MDFWRFCGYIVGFWCCVLFVVWVFAGFFGCLCGLDVAVLGIAGGLLFFGGFDLMLIRCFVLVCVLDCVCCLRSLLIFCGFDCCLLFVVCVYDCVCILPVTFSFGLFGV